MKFKSSAVKLTLPLVFASALLGGCKPKVTVDYMERYHFADFLMKPDRDPLLLKMNDHAYFSREGARGGRAVGGGGCGCN